MPITVTPNAAGWSEGYVTDTLYTDSVFREQAPAWINFVAGKMGCVPRPLDEPFAYLELGCGMGHSITIFAAAHPKARFVGVDFNPAHIDHAQRRARALGLGNLTFIEASFQDLAADPGGTGLARGLGQFDFAALHGIYSWISADARHAVQRLLFDRVLPGGLVYNSYNCLPGWAAEAPLQRLMKELSGLGSGGSSARLRAAITQMKSMAALKTGYFNVSPQIANALENYSKKNDNYLAHEFLNGSWNAFYAADVADEMAAAKLDFVGSATLVENHGNLLMGEASLALVNQQPDLRHRQMVQDFLINQRFRRDVFVRGHGRKDAAAIAAIRAAQCLVPAKSLAALAPTVKVGRGTVNIDPTRFKHLIAALDDRGGTVAEISAAFAKATGGPADSPHLLDVLTAAGHLTPAAMVPARPAAGGGHAAKGETGKVQRHAIPLAANQAILASAIARKMGVTLVSPVLGNGAPCKLHEALLIDEVLREGGEVADLVTRIEARMKALDVRLARNAKFPNDPAGAQAQLTSQIEGLLADELPSWVRLGILTPAP